MLQGRYDHMPIIPVKTVASDFFGHDTRTFLRKVESGDIPLPVVKMEASQKSAKGIHIEDLAQYVDIKRLEAKREYDRIFN